ncbi:BRD4-interacting chromatin-remodeling complex-associated protein-like isoform X1 [Nerophis ophidion]|uniref:BRD4-interacting chromatin-remodeling complex-associated protein-like isoform X1 n=1 Tax=Nerophis ophidion TaxID=159077 RepID=UPI002ADFEDA3|nr:BRD4-interacting chromatin-remodeling complex-associated protein-like isoform X1 [Nerophis ophidion]XP_061763686.1 BRD4-interacting chromatin-remodeling complex-associated protein-like isoform X1 [Nerophis ophidion]
MDDEDDRHLLDILGDVDALNDYLHGNNSKSIEEDDVANAAYGSDASFFAGDTASANERLKDGTSPMADFGGDSARDGLQLSSSLSFIEDQLGTGSSPGGGVDLGGGEDQPFDILQKSLLEADITEQTLAQEALLDSQPAPTLVQAPVSFPSQLASGGYGGGGVTTATAAAALPSGQVLRGVPPLSNGSAQHIQVLGSFGAGGGVMTLSSLERTPQIVLRPAGAVAPAASTPGGQVFAPTQGQLGQVGLPFKNIPLQNVIIQRGPGGTQTLVRPIQPKPHQAGAQTVYSLQPAASTFANVANAATPGAQYTANGSIVVQPPLDQQHAPANLQPGQFLLPASLALTQPGAVHNGPADPGASTLITAQKTVQIVAGQNFTAQAGGPLLLNQGGGGVTQTWTSTAHTACSTGRLALVNPASHGQVSACPVQRLLVTQTQNCTSLSPLPNTVTHEQNSSLSAVKQVQLSSVHAMQTPDLCINTQVSAQKRPAPMPLTKGGMILQQLREDHDRVHTPDRQHFTSFSDVLQRLLPFHVFQGAPPTQEEFSQVDDEFESVATQVLMRTQSMINKYRRLLLAESEQHCSPSSEMVMIDRTFNQEERGNLTQDKRMVLVDPDSFLDDFCCGLKSKRFQDPVPSPPPVCERNQLDRDMAESPYRTDFQPGFGDPGGGAEPTVDRPQTSPSENNSVSELKRAQQRFDPAPTCHPQGNHSTFAAPDGQTVDQVAKLASPRHLDTDSALEAAVNSILEC